VLSLTARAHAALGVRVAGYRLSLRGDGDKYVADPAMWDRAENLLRSSLDQLGLSYLEAKGEAAFYGPKIDIQVLDAAGREFTISTVQLDFYQPEQFDLSYVDSGGARRRPVMIHRSLVGSMERLFAYLIEVHDGAFPVWYSPVQVAVWPVGPDQFDAASDFSRQAIAAGLRVELLSEGSLGARIREAAQRRIPYGAVIGAREAAAGDVSLRLRDGQSLDPLPIAGALSHLCDAAKVAVR
jgi:threonyl-tRNA synthetase